VREALSIIAGGEDSPANPFDEVTVSDDFMNTNLQDTPIDAATVQKFAEGIDRSLSANNMDTINKVLGGVLKGIEVIKDVVL